MAWDADLRHLTSQQIQELLDRQLPPGEEATAQEHLSACSRCRSEVEAWSLLFADLADLPVLEPSPLFSEEVLEDARLRAHAGSWVRGWLAAREGRRREEAHIPPSSIQDYLENLLSPQPAARVEAHLDSCASCRREVREWESLLGAVAPLPHFSPAPGFAERVMAQVMLPVPMPARAGGIASFPKRAAAWAREILPQTRHGWAVAGGIASAPTITLVTLVYLVFSRPLLTLGNLGAYLLWKVSEAMGSILSVVSTLVLESATLFRIYSFLEPLTRSPALLGLGALAFSLLSAGALWVLYRNLFVIQPGGGHARARL